MKQDVRILPIGGQSENGKNMYCIEIDSKIIIIDAGIKFPDSSSLGIDIVIPSLDYLLDHKDQIVGIIITHGHNDTMAALPFLLEVINAPVYAPKLTAQLIESNITNYNELNNTYIQPKIHKISRNDSIMIDKIPVEFFSVTHSIPGSVGVAIWTSAGYIVYSGEYIIDFSAPHGFKSDIQKMMDISKKGVLALLCESHSAKNEGYTSPHHRIESQLEPIFEDSKGRIIITNYTQNVFRMKEIIELAIKFRRPILFYSNNVNNDEIVDICENYPIPIIKIPQHMRGSIKRLGNRRFDNDYVIIISGNPTELYSDLSNIIVGEDKYLQLRKDDSFIIASPVLPGIERFANKLHNDLYRTKADIFMLDKKKMMSMHASKEDIKVIIQIFQPKYFIPIKGDYSHLIVNKQIATEMGIEKENIPILDNGEFFSLIGDKIAPPLDPIEINEVMIQGRSSEAIGDKVINDRVLLSGDGVIIVGITVDAVTKEIICNTDIQSRGFVYLKDSDYILKNVVDICEEVIYKWQKDPTRDIIDVRSDMRSNAIKYISSETDKKPVFITVVVEI